MKKEYYIVQSGTYTLGILAIKPSYMIEEVVKVKVKEMAESFYKKDATVDALSNDGEYRLWVTLKTKPKVQIEVFLTTTTLY